SVCALSGAPCYEPRLSAAASGKRRGADAERMLNLLHDDLWGHSHTTADARSGDDAVAVGNGCFDLSRHPAEDIEFRNNNVLGVLGRFSNFFSGPRPQALDL